MKTGHKRFFSLAGSFSLDRGFFRAISVNKLQEMFCCCFAGAFRFSKKTSVFSQEAEGFF
jgi:hypothetical protein